MLPKTRYAKSGNVHIAYQAFGNGDVDLVFVPGFVSNIEVYWDEPHFARWLRKLASFARVITFDKRGTGLSDRLEVLPTMDERMDDVRAVMDAAGSKRAAILGLSEGGSLATVFAAHYPKDAAHSFFGGPSQNSVHGFRRPKSSSDSLIMWRRIGGLEATSACGCHQRRTILYFGNGSRNASGRARVPLQSWP
jgi:pimeloyl-ACP methyl ester carboxylesterase